MITFKLGEVGTVSGGFPGGSDGQDYLPAVQETWVQSQGQELNRGLLHCRWILYQ